MVSDTKQNRPTAWNAGGWFGSQLGSTLWLAISAALLAARSVAVASTVFALFLVVNLVGVVLWHRRYRISIFSALQILLTTFWACSMAAVFVIDRAGLWETLAVGGNNNIPATRTYAMLTVLVLALGVMIRFLHRKQSARRDGV